MPAVDALSTANTLFKHRRRSLPKLIANLPASLEWAYHNWQTYTYEDNTTHTVKAFVTRLAAAFRRVLPELVLTDGTRVENALDVYNSLPPTWVRSGDCLPPPPEPADGAITMTGVDLHKVGGDDAEKILRNALCPFWKAAEAAIASKDCEALLWSIFNVGYERRHDGTYDRVRRGLLPIAPALAVIVEEGETSWPDMSDPTKTVAWWTTLLLCDSLVRTCCPTYKLEPPRFTQPGIPYWMIAATRAGIDLAAFRDHAPLPPRPEDDDLLFRARIVRALRGLVFERDWLDSEARARAVETDLHEHSKHRPLGK